MRSNWEEPKPLGGSQSRPSRKRSLNVSLSGDALAEEQSFMTRGMSTTVFICPTPDFNRDKHAEMVVRALQKLGVDRTRVNERHDIVRDSTEAKSAPLKVSGSAYKLTRLRSLHHGTCLLSSPNLAKIGQYLRSPAKQYITAKGVESVSSPITNVHVPNEEFEKAVAAEFVLMYGDTEPVVVAESATNVPEIKEGMNELMSMDWIYSQTPEFSFKSRMSKSLEISFVLRNGRIKHSDIRLEELKEREDSVNELLVGRKLIEIDDWDENIGLPTKMDDFFPTPSGVTL